MRLEHIHPHPLLKGYVEKLWVFENDGKFLSEDMKLIVPNGMLKLVIPFKNGLSGKNEGWYHLSKEHSITLIGMCDMPSIVDAELDKPVGTIGVEFSPKGAYRFLHLNHSDIKNKIHSLEQVLGKAALQLQEQICNATAIEQKIFLMQKFLLTLFFKTQPDTVFDFCIDKIQHSKGRTTVKELERQTGYSSRWLNMKFIDKAGISPKNLSSLIRFQQYFQSMVNNSEASFFKNEFYHYYYDQSHFIKDFKRFTGLTPSKFEHSNNDFGKIFYKE